MPVPIETDWQATDALSETSLRDLFAGDIPAIRLSGFASDQECARFCNAIREHSGAAKQAYTAKMTLLGANFSNFTGKSKGEYFETVDPSYALTDQLAQTAGFSPLQRFLETLRATWPDSVDVAHEPGHGRYFAGGVKTRATSGHLHYDFTPHSSTGYAIADITDQAGMNLYLEMPDNTGHTITYRRMIPREGRAAGDGPARVLNLDASYIEGADSFTFMPTIGDLIIINTRNPHDIIVENIQNNQWRAQTSCFIGRKPDNSLILWS